MTFAGFKSRWMTPRPWARLIALQIGRRIPFEAVRSRELLLPGLALDVLHDEHGAAFEVPPQQMDGHDARVLEPGGDACLVDQRGLVARAMRDLRP